jgi:hypothetical protein
VFNNPVMLVDPDGMAPGDPGDIDKNDKSAKTKKEEKKVEEIKDKNEDEKEVKLKKDEPKNTAKEILESGMAAALVLAFDPIPGDEIVVAGGTLLAAGAAWITSEIILFAAEHTKGARPSTKPTHQKGKARKMQDRQGSKGEKLPPRKRPENHKGPWPAKEQLKK